MFPDPRFLMISKLILHVQFIRSPKQPCQVSPINPPTSYRADLQSEKWRTSWRKRPTAFCSTVSSTQGMRICVLNGTSLVRTCTISFTKLKDLCVPLSVRECVNHETTPVCCDDFGTSVFLVTSYLDQDSSIQSGSIGELTTCQTNTKSKLSHILDRDTTRPTQNDAWKLLYTNFRQNIQKSTTLCSHPSPLIVAQGSPSPPERDIFLFRWIENVFWSVRWIPRPWSKRRCRCASLDFWDGHVSTCLETKYYLTKIYVRQHHVESPSHRRQKQKTNTCEPKLLTHHSLVATGSPSLCSRQSNAFSKAVVGLFLWMYHTLNRIWSLVSISLWWFRS